MSYAQPQDVVSPVVFTATGRPMNFDPTQLSPNLLLEEALENPGMLSQAYSRFHGYSLGNRLAVLFQCIVRKLEPGPFAAYAAWQKLDRQVRKGEKALFIMHPMMRKQTDEATGKEENVLVGFTWKPTAFVLSQTDGEDLELAELVPFDLAAVLKEVNITPVPFTIEDGNCLGFANQKREISVSPLSPRPERTLFHEVGHILLGHCEKGTQVDIETFGYGTHEVEAEAFSYLVCGMLGMADDEAQKAESRGYISHWMQNGAKGEWTDQNARRVFSAVDRFLSLTKKAPSTTMDAAAA